MERRGPGSDWLFSLRPTLMMCLALPVKRAGTAEKEGHWGEQKRRGEREEKQASSSVWRQETDHSFG
jgi:hypothetical protein